MLILPRKNEYVCHMCWLSMTNDWKENCKHRVSQRHNPQWFWRADHKVCNKHYLNLFFPKYVWYLPKTSLIFDSIEKHVNIIFIAFINHGKSQQVIQLCQSTKKPPEQDFEVFFDHIIIWSIFNFLSGNTGLVASPCYPSAFLANMKALVSFTISVWIAIGSFVRAIRFLWNAFLKIFTFWQQPSSTTFLFCCQILFQVLVPSIKSLLGF